MIAQPTAQDGAAAAGAAAASATAASATPHPAAAATANAAATSSAQDAATANAATTGYAEQLAAPPRWWRFLGWPSAVVIVAAGGMVLGGVPAWRAGVLAGAIGAALWAIITTMNTSRLRWPDDLPAWTYHRTMTWEVSGLVAARESADAFEYYLRPRLWALACDLFDRRGVAPESADARALLGARAYDLLTGVRPDPAAVPLLCQMLARLAVSPELPGPVPLRQQTMAGLAGRMGRSKTPTPGDRRTRNPGNKRAISRRQGWSRP